MTATEIAPPAPPQPAPGELAELAARHGLSVSGARPAPLAYLRQLWGRRQFVLAFATARLTSQYAASRLGQVWQVMTPLLNAAVFYFVFGVLLGTKRGVPDFVPFLVTGVFVWTFTATTVGAAAKAISGNLGLVRALHFPRACLPISITLQCFQQLLFSLLALAPILIAFGQYPSPRWLLAVPALLLQLVFNTGLALVVARLGSRTPDFAQLVPFVVRVWMYVSGVMWSIDRIAGSHRVPHVVYLMLRYNPPALFIDLVRYALIDSFRSSQLPAHAWIAAALWAGVWAVVGYLFFWQAEERYGRG